MDGIADVEAGKVHLDEFGNGIGRHEQLDRMAHHVQDAAALQAGRGHMIDEVHRHVQRQGGAFADAQEIHVNDEIAHRIELEILRDRADLLAVHLDLDEMGEESAGMQPVRQLALVEGDGKRRLLVAIDDGRDLVLTAHGAGGPLADPVAHLGLELRELSHEGTPDLRESEKAAGAAQFAGAASKGASACGGLYGSGLENANPV